MAPSTSRLTAAGPRRVAAVALLLQAVAVTAIVAAHSALSHPVVTTFGSTDFVVSNVNIGAGVIVPLVLGAAVLLSGTLGRALRWLEVALSSSIMLFLIALLNGIHELGALVAMYALTSAIALFGALHEERASREGMRAAVFGAMVGIVPWGLIAWYEIVPSLLGDAGPAPWVRVLTVTVLVLFLARGVNFWYSSRGRGHWGNLAFGARLGLLLAVLERSALAWQVAAAIVLGLSTTLN